MSPSSVLNQDTKVVSAFSVSSLGNLVGEGYHSFGIPSLAIVWAYHPGAYPNSACSHVGHDFIPSGRRAQGTSEVIGQCQILPVYRPRDSEIGRVVVTQTSVLSTLKFDES